MEKEFVSYEQAVALKDLGFNEPCLAYYQHWITTDGSSQDIVINGDCECCDNRGEPAPLKQQVFRWFRKKYDSSESIWSHRSKWIFAIKEITSGYYLMGESPVYNSYEEAENACIDKLIEIAKQQGK